MNTTVLMSDALNFSALQAINPYYGTSEAVVEIAQREHDSIRMALTSAGVSVLQTPSPADSQDGVYTANWALVRDGTAVLARLPEVRKAEEMTARATLEQLGMRVVEVPEGLRFSGQGDALACGDLLFCGRGYRSDEAAQKFAADLLGFTRIQLQTIPQLDEQGRPVINAVSGWADSFFYDIDLALSVIRIPKDGKPGLIAFCREAFTAESQATLDALSDVDKIEISMHEAKEAFAANLVSTGDTVIMSAQAPDLKLALEQRGLRVLTPEISELSKGGGYIRCTSLSIS